MKPYGGFRDRPTCWIHGDGCNNFFKRGWWKSRVRKATKHFARQAAKQEIRKSIK